MPSLFNRMIAGVLPYVPRAVVGRVAKRYIAGETIDDALAMAERLAQDGFTSTVDVLGEDVEEAHQVPMAMEEYLTLVDRIAERDAPAGVSLKLTQLGIRFDPEGCRRCLEEIVDRAAERSVFVRVDMEDSSLTSATLDLVASLRATGVSHLGAVIQAYLHRTQADVETVIQQRGNLRLCKGIYQESAEIAFQDREEVRESFLAAGRRLLDSGTFIGIATHDEVLIEGMREHLETHEIPPDRYEFQALLGVPITAILKRLRAAGHPVRIYIPYGTDWFAYSTRRLKENPDMAGNVLRGLFRIDR